MSQSAPRYLRIVSGYDGDGAEALCGIKEVGGVTIAQKLRAAKQSDLLESVIASGCIDFIRLPGKLCELLALNIVNAGTLLLKLYTLYAPPNHRDGVIHETRADAGSDTEHFDGKATE